MQHETTQVQHEYNTTQHEYNTGQHEYKTNKIYFDLFIPPLYTRSLVK